MNKKGSVSLVDLQANGLVFGGGGGGGGEGGGLMWWMEQSGRK